jgi:hypothetical protein
MESETSPAPRSRPPLRRFIAAALSGGLGVFGIAAADTTAASQQGSAVPPPANVAPAERPSD